MNKLARKDLGLDIAAYKDYVNNLKEFAHINKDLNVFAAESLALDQHMDDRELIRVERKSTLSQPEIQKHLEGAERVKANSKSILFTLAKFLRSNSGFISARDRSAVKELLENLELYMFNDSYLCD